tara:strand:- start:3149 stop:3745 length:597 start_codon:yes stop_codon:yes gene_type:complete
MARKAEFTLKGKSVMAELKKVDRKKIYGWSNIEVYDENESICKLAGLAEGRYVMPSGSTSLITLDSKGESVSRSSLVGVDKDGKKVPIVSSIYDEKVVLNESSIDDYLTLAVKSVYQLNLENDDFLLDELNSGKIYHFIFNYRADYEGDDAFLISNENEVFAITGMCAELDFIGLENNEQELYQEDQEEDDDLDFAMF